MHVKDPKFVALRERLEKIKESHEQGLLDSKEFLKQLLELARDVVEAEQDVNPVNDICEDSRTYMWTNAMWFPFDLRISLMCITEAKLPILPSGRPITVTFAEESA